MQALLLHPWWRAPGNSRWAILVRLSLAGVFVLEGLQKLLFPEILGSGRFAGIGIPLPGVTGPLVGVFELVCGALLLLGLLSRYAAVPLIVIMVVAIVSTKIPILLGTDWLIFHARELSRYGFWSFAHETRTDWAMLLGALYVLLAGPGPWSLDRLLFGRRGG
jgi:putative oxidoreductase